MKQTGFDAVKNVSKETKLQFIMGDLELYLKMNPPTNQKHKKEKKVN